MAVIKLDENLLLLVENAIASGAQTDSEIAKAVGLKLAVFRNIKYGKRKNGKIEKSKMANAIKKGQARQRETIFQKAEYSLIKKIEGYTVKETDTKKEKINGKLIITETRERIKHIQPDTTAIMFALNNLSDGKYVQRRNEPEPEDSKPAFQKWVEEQKK